MSQEMAPGYEGIVLRCRKLAEKSDAVMFEEIGPSEEGRPLPKLTLGDAEADRPLMMVMGGIHGSEETGRAVALGLAEWLAGEGRGYLEKMTVVVVPCVNPDGSVKNMSRNARHMDIGASFRRDGAAETAEGRAIEAVAQALLPDCFVDVHGLAGASMGGLEYLYPTPHANLGFPISFAVAAEMDREATRLGIPLRHPKALATGDCRSLPSKLAVETNALCLGVETTEKYYPLEHSALSGVCRLKKLVEIGVRVQYNQPYPGFPCDTIIGGPMYAIMPHGGTYRERRENRAATVGVILESAFCNLTRSCADKGGVAELNLEIREGARRFPKGVVFQAALDPRAAVKEVSYEWFDGSRGVLERGRADGYTIWDEEGFGIQKVRCALGRPPGVGNNRARIRYEVPFAPHEAP